MPRLSKALPKYRKHRASGKAVVTLGGADYYLGPHGTKASKTEYDRLVGEWLSNGRNPLLNSPNEISVVELCARYWKFAQGYYQKNGKPTGTTDSIKQAVRFLKDWYGQTMASEFGPLALKAMRQRMVDDGLSRNYVNALVDIIRRMFRWGVSEQLIPVAVHQALATVPGLRKGRSQARETRPVEPVEDSTVDATLPHMPTVVADMVRLQRLTGCRPDEVCSVRPCDLDRSGEVWTYKPESHKTEHHGRDRTIFIGPQAQGVLLRYLARDTHAYCFRPCDSEEKRLAEQEANRKTPRSCGNVRGSNLKKKPKRQPSEKYDTNSYRRAIHRACDRAFVHPTLGRVLKSSFTEDQRAELRKWQSEHRWSPNRLRHAAATEIRREYGLEAAQVTLGHASADVTQVYAERDHTLAIEVARGIG